MQHNTGQKKGRSQPADSLARFRRILGLAIVLAATSTAFLVTVRSSGAESLPLAGGAISGVVYRDYDADGVRDLREPGEPGVAVQATCLLDSGVDLLQGTSDDVYASGPTSTVSTTDGSWLINASGSPCRISVVGPTTKPFLRSAAHPQDGPSSSDRMVAVGVTGVALAVASPSTFCQSAPTVIASCFIIGPSTDSTVAATSSIYAVPYQSSGLNKATIQTLAKTGSTGSVYGMAYHRKARTVFSGAYVKRGTDLGPLGPGGIYATDLATGISRPFLTLDATIAGSDPHPSRLDPVGGVCSYRSGLPAAIVWAAGTCWEEDRYAIDAAGAAGLGDVDISDDGTRLYTVGLRARTLEIISVVNGQGSSSTALSAGGVRSVAIPRPVACPSTVGEFRPMGLGVMDDDVIVGVVCDAAVSQNPSDLRGYLYRFSGFSQSFDPTPIAEIPLGGVTRGQVWSFSPTVDTDHWNPWTSSPHFITHPIPSLSFLDLYRYPTPIIADIAVDGRDLIVGFRDRTADQIGFGTFQSNGRPGFAMSAGDIVRVCHNGTAFVVENGGKCNGKGSGLNAEGIGGGEFYGGDTLAGVHMETADGGLAQVAGSETLVVAAMDPLRQDSGGITWLSNETGQSLVSGRELYRSTFPGALTFDKSNGLGDIEVLCDMAPIEIGNRVWFDSNRNGVQDAAEPPIPNVTVHLYDATGAAIGTTKTDPLGQWWFGGVANANLLSGRTLQEAQRYDVRLDNPSDYTAGGPLVGLTLTRANALPTTPTSPLLDGTLSDRVDSDGTLVNSPQGSPAGTFPVVNLTAGQPGDNDETLDFGFFVPLPAIPTSTTTTVLVTTTTGASTTSTTFPVPPPPPTASTTTVATTTTTTTTPCVPPTSTPTSPGSTSTTLPSPRNPSSCPAPPTTVAPCGPSTSSTPSTILGAASAPPSCPPKCGPEMTTTTAAGHSSATSSTSPTSSESCPVPVTIPEVPLRLAQRSPSTPAFTGASSGLLAGIGLILGLLGLDLLGLARQLKSAPGGARSRRRKSSPTWRTREWTWEDLD